jgi:predicted nucleotidyltransferase
MNSLLNRIFETTTFDENEDYNIYLTGSRVYGTNTEKSDYDFYIIVSDEYFKKISKKNSNLGEEEYECLYFGDDINVNLYSKSLFQRKLNENWLQSLMCVYSEKENCLMRKFEFEFEIYFRKLGRSVIGEAGKHYEMARRKWDQENPYQSEKYLIHSFRDFMFGIQIAKDFKIVDYKCANDLYFEIMDESLSFHSNQRND